MRLTLVFSGPATDESAFFEVRAEIDPATPADTRTLAGEFMEHAVIAFHAMGERGEDINARLASSEDA